jgi:uncharacterized protein YrrD
VRLADYDGADVVTSDGDKIGTVEKSYLDEGGAVHFVEVKIGGLLAKHRLVPAGNAQMTDNGLAVPYGKSAIEGSPDAKHAGHTVGPAVLEDVRSYYDGIQSPATEDTNSNDDTASDTPVAEARSNPATNADNTAAIQKGMDVVDVNGDKIGTVDDMYDVQSAESQGSHGADTVLKVVHRGLLPLGGEEYYVPTRDVQSVKPGESVMLSCAKDACADRYSEKPSFVG